MDFVQEVDVLDEKVEHRNHNLLSAAVGHLGPLCGPLEGRAVVAEVAGRIHVVLCADGREGGGRMHVVGSASPAPFAEERAR